MKVILKESVKAMGTAGTVLEVADGYGRNYLIPKKLAVEANPRNIKRVEHEKNAILEKAKKTKKTVEELAGRLSEMTVSIEALAGEEDKLFGAVTAIDIADALSKQGVEIDKRKIMLNEPIKRLGTYTLSIKLHPEVAATVNVEVKKS